jgi:hypothetical protein
VSGALDDTHDIVGSLTQVMPSPLLTPELQAATAGTLQRAAAEISDRMADGEMAEEPQRPRGAIIDPLE